MTTPNTRTPNTTSLTKDIERVDEDIRRLVEEERLADAGDDEPGDW
ncbi:hypothetical protein [Streptomyces sp. 1222.5]